MTEGLRIAHPQDCPLEGNPEVGNPEGNHMMAMTHCQDHILTENIWFAWSKTSYSGDKRRCYQAGRTTNKGR